MPLSGITRRGFVRQVTAGALGLSAGALGSPGRVSAQKTTLTPDQALALLREGNQNFVAGTTAHPSQDRGRRRALAHTQGPFAAIVSCSDSRVPPELVFDRGLGDLFTIRVAGNTVDTNAAMGSVEYAVGVLTVPLVVVMGHERCGAVEAALSIAAKKTAYPGSIGPMVAPILPAAATALATRANGDALVDAAIAENVRRVIAQLQTSVVLAPPVKSGRLRIVGARYDLDDGRVEFYS